MTVIVGYGRIGQRLSWDLEAEGREHLILHHDSPIDAVKEAISVASNIVLTMPLTGQSQGWLDTDKLSCAAQLRVVCPGRIGLLDMRALNRAIKDGRVEMAYIDTVVRRQIPGVRFTRHTAWFSKESSLKRAQLTIEAIAKVRNELSA